MQDMIATPGHAHASMEQELTLIHDLLGGTMTMRRAGAKWLPREEAESWSAWQGRLQRSVLFNGLGRLIQVLSGKPFEKEVKLQNAHPQIEALAQNMDGCHRALPEFTRLLLHALLADGIVHIQIDRPRDGGQPYFIIRQARQLIGATTDETGALSQIRIKETQIQRSGDYAEKAVQVIRLFDKQGWQVWQEIDGQAGKWKMTSQGEHDFGAVPLVSIIVTPTGFMTGRPPLMDMAWLNLAHWQSSSDQRHILHVARVPILFGRGLQLAERGLEVGPNRLILSDDPSADLKFVEHSGAAIEAGRQDLRDLEERMAIMGLDMIARRPGGMTATARAIDQAQCHAALTAIITNLHQGLMQALQEAARWMGLDESAAGTIDLSLKGMLEQDVQQMASWLLDARLAGELTADQFLAEAKRYGLIDGSSH